VQEYGEARGIQRDNLQRDLETGEIKRMQGELDQWIRSSEALPEVIIVTHVHPPSTGTNGELLHMLAPWRHKLKPARCKARRDRNTARSQPPLMQMSYQQLTACKEEDGHWLALMIKLDPIFSNTAAAQPFGGCWL
jgi:hypothetical protein